MTNKNDTIWSLTHQGETSLQLGNYDDAVEYFTKAIEKKPSAWLYAHRGEALRLKKSFDKALEDFHKAIELSGGAKSDYAWAYAHMGETYRLMGGYNKQAPEYFTDAIRINPSYAWAYAHRGASRGVNDDKEIEPALEDFNKAISLYSKYAWAYACRSAVYLKMGEDDRAYYDLLHAISLDNTIVREPIILELKQLLKQRIAASKTSKITTPLPD